MELVDVLPRGTLASPCVDPGPNTHHRNRGRLSRDQSCPKVAGKDCRNSSHLGHREPAVQEQSVGHEEQQEARELELQLHRQAPDVGRADGSRTGASGILSGVAKGHMLSERKGEYGCLSTPRATRAVTISPTLWSPRTSNIPSCFYSHQRVMVATGTGRTTQEPEENNRYESGGRSGRGLDAAVIVTVARFHGNERKSPWHQRTGRDACMLCP